MNQSQPVLEGRDLQRDFKVGDRVFTALKPTSISLKTGQFTVITGPSGSGKSTLMNLLSGLDQPSRGEVYLQGKALHRMSVDQLAHIRNRFFGFVFQSPHVLNVMTVLENVLLPFHYADTGITAQARKRAAELLEYVGLADFARRYPGTLSGGELQRLVFARALVRDPQVIFADEPTGNLDAENSRRLLSLLAEQAAQGRSVLMVTHDAESVSYGTDVFRMDKFQQ